ncbi:2-hydroxyacid dehydrogenase [Bacillus sp. APMAM]|nr:2-hydroxyacid dehydrogenase [Bacillus sp. APMAM]RTZ56210.1 phosphoglycerate dehydrogenase [Bacillus sp. SAJ1]
MKAVIVGDVFVTADQFEEAIKQWDAPIDQVVKLSWGPNKKEEFQETILEIERSGPEAVSPPKGLLEQIVDADFLLVHFAPVSQIVLEAAQQLKVIGTCRGGMEHINLAFAKSRGIPVVNVIRNAEAVADFTIGLIYSETRNIARSHHALKEGKWVKDFPNYSYTKSVKDQIVGIVGLGNIGRIVAKNLIALGIPVIGSDPYVTSQELSEEGIEINLVSLDELFEAASIVTVHVRLSEETKGLIKENHILKMKKDSYLINTSRAEVMEEKPLCEALVNKQIAGAAIDVFWQEPIPQGHPLLLCDNVTLTPHIAGDTVDALPKSPIKLVENLKKTLKLEKIEA